MTRLPLIALLSLLVCLPVAALAADAKTRKPNIIFIMADDK